MQRRADFSFPGSPARGGLLPPRPPAVPPRYGADEAEEEEVRWLQASPDYGSGTPSPQLWGAAHPHHERMYPASAGASPSRAQSIAGYRREMLDLVRGLPESAYELSLRDIVERPAPAPASPPRPSLTVPSPPPPTQKPSPSPSPAAAAAAPRGDAAGAKDAVAAAEDGQAAGSKGKRQGRKQRATMRKQRSGSLERSVSLDTGLLIKLFLPLSIAAGRKKKVSPKPDAAKDGKKKEKKAKKQGSKKTKKEAAVAAPAQGEEEEWWTKSESSEAGASSRTSSTGSSSNASVRNVNGAGGANPRAPARSWSRKRTGCYAFFRANKGKSGVNQD